MVSGNGITGNNHQQLGYFNQLISNRVVCRVKFVAEGANGRTPYDATSTIAADTSLNPSLTDKTVEELKDLCTADENFLFAEERSIYRYAGGTTTGTLTIPLAKVNKTCIVGGFGVITDSCGGTQTFSVGIPGNNDFILGATVGTDLAVPTGCENALWTQSYPFASASPDLGGVGAGRIYYAPDRMLAPGTPINLYITAGTSSTIGTGDITFELLATAIGQETYGVVDGNNAKSNTNGGPGPMFGKDRGPIYPAF